MNADGSGLAAADRSARASVRHRSDLPARRPDPVHLDARAEVLHVQPAHHGQPVHDGRRRGEHPADRPQHAARGPRLAAARRPRALRPLGIRGPQLRRRPGRVERQPRRHEPRRLLGQQHQLARRRARRPRPIPGTEISSSPPSPPATTGPGARWRSSTAGWASTAGRRWCAPGPPTPSTWSARATTTRSSR